MARKVVKVNFHQMIHIPGVAGLQTNTLPPLNKTVKLDMEADSTGIFIKAEGKEAIVPWANVVVAIFAPEEPKS